MKNKLLEIKNLHVQYKTDEATVYAVNGVDLYLCEGEALGLVGETGAGKTTLALSILKLLPDRVGRIVDGEILLGDTNLVTAAESTMRKIRGDKISMIFQDPMSSLNPTMTVGKQLAEVLELHTDYDAKHVQARVDEILKLVGISPDRKNDYPHQFSGGMKQRVVIAMALACDPAILLADEPTTALDVTIQAQVLDVIRQLKDEFNTAMLLITHDLGVIAETCDRVAIMYAGEIVETGTVEDIFSPIKRHPYTEGLLGSIPSLTEKSKRLSPIPGLMVDPTIVPEGCRFYDRCLYRKDICRLDCKMVKLTDTHSIRCCLFQDSLAIL